MGSQRICASTSVQPEPRVSLKSFGLYFKRFLDMTKKRSNASSKQCLRKQSWFGTKSKTTTWKSHPDTSPRRTKTMRDRQNNLKLTVLQARPDKCIFRHNLNEVRFQQPGSLPFRRRVKRLKESGAHVDDFIENSILQECLRARIRTNLSSLRNLLKTLIFLSVDFNPFEDYFFNLQMLRRKTGVSTG
jgi:hypothetical protein